MNRRDFFKFLGIGTATAAVAQNVLANPTPLPMEKKEWHWKNEWGPLSTWPEMSSPADYSIGVDVASGLGNDPSCVSVMRVGKAGEPDLQVAEFVSYTITPTDLTMVIAQIAKKYSANCTDLRGPILVIEQIRGYGDVVQAHLKIMGFTRFFVTTKLCPNNRVMKRDGWYTTAYSGPILAQRFMTAIRAGWYKPKSVHLKGVANQSERQMLSNSHIMAAAQSYVGAHVEQKENRNG